MPSQGTLHPNLAMVLALLERADAVSDAFFKIIAQVSRADDLEVDTARPFCRVGGGQEARDTAAPEIERLT